MDEPSLKAGPKLADALLSSDKLNKISSGLEPIIMAAGCGGGGSSREA